MPVPKRPRVAPLAAARAPDSKGLARLAVPPGHEGIAHGATGTVVRWQVATGAEVKKDALIVSCRFEAVQIAVLAPHDGVIKSVFVQEGEPITAASILGELEYCLHSVATAEGLCALCGKQLAALSGHTINVEGGFRVQVNQEEALSSRARSITRLFQNKRLSLVLDLDHTLVHCTDDPNAGVFVSKGAPNLSVFELGGKTLYLKARPGLASFLKEMHDLFDLYVYTAGTRAYAEKVCTIMDSNHVYFGGRIVSRDDTPELGLEKSLERLFPVDDSMVVIVDDRDVWSNSPNLLTCEPYHFFVGMHDVNNQGWHPDDGGDDDDAVSSAPAVAPLDDSKMDAGLLRVATLLRRVHREFYYPAHGQKYTLEQQLSGLGNDVKRILGDMKRSVLSRAIVAFDPTTPYVETLYHRTKLCGATVVDKVDSSVTHLVAPRDTDLAQFARGLGVLVVHPRWIELSDHNWQRAVEEPYCVYRVEGFGSGASAVPRRSSGGSPRVNEGM